MKDSKSYVLRKILVIGLIIVTLCLIYVMFQNNGFSRFFEDFNGPEYIPNGYNNTDNMTNDNARIFEYKGNGTFYAGVIKNTINNDLHDIMNPFEDDPENTVKKNESISVNGHMNVTFQTSEYDLDLHGIDLTGMIPTNYDLPTKIPDVKVNMVKFQATWRCNETGLTYIIEGLVTSDQLEEMKKTIISIKCHSKQNIWDLLKIHF